MFGSPKNMIAVRGTENSTTEMPNCCTLFNIRHSPRSSHAPWRNGLVAAQKENLGAHLRMFLGDT